jgi:hypothetical protein
MAGQPHPWDAEPDELEAESHGFTVRLRRNTELGTWCGYVIIPEDHPWHGLSYGDLVDVSVHGGVTFADHGLFHEQYAVGFDCSHAFDLIPLLVTGALPGGALETMDRGTYRDMEYALDECRHLAEQARVAGGTPDDPLDRTDDELRRALKAMRGEVEPEPELTGAPSLHFPRRPNETDAEFKRRIIEDNARMAAGMAPRIRKDVATAVKRYIDDPERKDPW